MKELILVPMAILANLTMVSLFKAIGNNRGEVPIEPASEPNPEPSPEPNPLPGPSAFDSLMTKKGWKSNDDVAKSYEEAESSLGRSQTAFNTTKQQLEAHGYAIDEKGNISQGQQQAPQQVDQYGQPIGQPAQNPYGAAPAQNQYGQPAQAELLYDPITGNPITNPLDIQLAQMPMSQRMTFVYNALADQREKQGRDAFTAEQEAFNDPSAKGFEEDTRRVMMQVPLAQRAKKESWQDALLKVKGMKYDDAIKNAGAQGVDNFLNKDGLQSIPAAGGTGQGAAKLSPDNEANYQYYQKNHPGMFKDRTHFAKRLQITG